MNWTERRSTPASPRVWAGASLRLVVAVLVVGCGAQAPVDGANDAPVRAQVDPGETTFASVRANGTGCPPGTANTNISSDGLVFTTTFSNYVTQVDTSTDVSVRDCQLDIALRTPEGRSYSVQTFSYAGFALLQPGVSGRQTANYYFQGNPVAPSESNRTELVGPYDRPYLFTDEIGTEDRVWSPCGVERNLNVVTRVQLFNSDPRRAGYMNLSSLDGSSKMRLVLASRPCEPQVQPPRSALAPAAQVAVAPVTIDRDEKFTVSWSTPTGNTDATYSVQLRTHENFGDGLIWESKQIAGRSVRYDGPPLSSAGTYQVLVVARRGDEEARSTRASLIVRDSVSPAALAPPTALRVQPSPIVRGQPFVVTWSASEGAPASTTYRVQVHEHRNLGFGLVATSFDTSGTIAALPAGVLAKNGTYQVIVVARDGSRTSYSEALTVDAIDATDPVVAPTPSVGSALIGRYAMRSLGYWFVAGGMTAVKELSLAEFVQVGGGGIELRTRLCAQESDSRSLTVEMRTPEAYPEIRRSVIVEGDRFFTEGGPVGTGYTREGIAACAGRAGQYITKQPEQRWIRGGSCRCPSSPASVPTIDDCRVGDPDGDGQPGLAYKWYGPSGTFDWTSHLATVQRSQLLGGTIAQAGLHSAKVRLDEATYPLGCEGTLCRVVGTAAQPCTSSYNSAQFVPLPDPPDGQPRWTCASLREREGRLFPRSAGSLPSRCERDTLTDAL